MTEVWKPVVGFEGLYEVSNLGRVRSLPRTVVARNRWGTYTERSYPGRMLKAYVNQERGGYRYVNLYDNGQHMRRVAVLVAAAFIGPRPEGQQVCHRDGVRTNDKACNLRYDTPVGNMADQLEHGTRRRGERHHQARLTTAEVEEIQRCRGLVPQQDLADVYGVSRGHINNIQCGFRRAYG